MRRLVLLLLILASGCGTPAPTGQSTPGEEAAPRATQAGTLEHRSNSSTITRSAGGAVRTSLGYGIVLNKKSTLVREWITVQDSVMPLDFVDTVGVRTIYSPGARYTSGEYRYTSRYRLRAAEPIAAFEVRCTIFDVWGEPLKTLTHTEVEDVPAGDTHPFEPEWRIYTENEALEFYASLCFVARVRTATGRVVAANMDPIVAEATRFSDRFAAEDLEPSAARGGQ